MYRRRRGGGEIEETVEIDVFGLISGLEWVIYLTPLLGIEQR